MLRLIIIVGLLLASTGPLFACGGWFSSTWCDGGERGVLRMPKADFRHELEAMAGYKNEWEHRWGQYPTSIRWESTLDADLLDLRAALDSASSRVADASGIVEQYKSLRLAMKVHADGNEDDSRINVRSATPAFDLSPHQNLLNALPQEFSLYIRGAVAYRARDCDSASREWHALLALPREDRLYRTTWATFMLGKCKVISNPTEAVALFEQTRALAIDGFHDTLGLAIDSLGWQAHVEESLGNRVAAMHHYYEQFTAGKGNSRLTGSTSLKRICSRVFESTDINTSLAEDTLCRRILTCWVLPNAGHGAKWLSLVRPYAKTAPIEGADRLAWLAYYVGDFDQAKEWLSFSDPSLPYARWVHSKFLLREGKINEAMSVLKELTTEFDPEDWWEENEYDIAAPFDRVNSELGVLHLGRKEFQSSLSAFMKGSSRDADYIAERVLTLKELESFVARLEKDASARSATESEEDHDSDYNPESRVRFLLARRLTRNKEYDKARPYYPKRGVKVFDEYVSHLRAARQTKQSSRQRAEHFYAAALMARKNGEGLMGTFIEPDGGDSWGWEHFLSGPTQWRTNRRASESIRSSTEAGLATPIVKVLLPSQDEKARIARSAPRPNQRWHYRYTAADLMWQCAQNLPNNDPMLAKALYTGGSYIKSHDPKAADKFYKALVRRCPKLPIAQEADRLRWFPEAPPEWKDSRDNAM